MDIFMVEVGVLLPKGHLEYDSYLAWDKQNAYFDEDLAFFLTKDKAIDFAKIYVDEGVHNTYAVVVVSELDELNYDDYYTIKAVEDSGCFDGDITRWLEKKEYVFSLYKDDKGTFHENFVKGEYV